MEQIFELSAYVIYIFMDVWLLMYGPELMPTQMTPQ